MSKTSDQAPVKEQEAVKPQKKLTGVVKIDVERCKGCGYCVAFCPLGVLVMSAKFNVKGYHYPELADGKTCSGCDLCGMYCPDFAVHGGRVTDRDKTKE